MFVTMANELVDEQNSKSREQALKQAATEFGQRVRQLRKAAGLTQQQLADRLSQWGRSYHQTTVAKLEAGTRPTTLEELIPLSVALGVSQREFFEDPSPEDMAEREIREAEQRVDDVQAELAKLREQEAALEQRLAGAKAALAELHHRDLSATLRAEQL